MLIDKRAHPKARRAAVTVGLFTFAFISILCAVALRSSEEGPLSFIRIGTRFADHDPNGTVGYDGQFAYYIAAYGANAVPYIDGPTLRYQRILYPLSARVLALGNPDLVPWTLIAVNVAAHSIGAALLTYLLVLYGVSPLAGLIYTFWVGAIFALRLDLNELLCFALALGALIAYHHRHYRWTILLLMLSTITKELGLIFAAGIALHAFAQGQRRWAVLFIASPLLLFLAWWGIMRLWFGTFPTIYPAARFHLIPLQGMFLEDSPVEFILLAIWLGIPAVILFVAALRYIWRHRVVPLGAALALMGAGFVLAMPGVSWDDPIAAYRVGMPLVISGMLFVAQCYPRRWLWLAGLWIPAILVALMAPTLWFGGA
jgi:hypothetical protein